MIAWPHLLQGTLDSGWRSPGMNTFVLQLMHVTILRGLSAFMVRQLSTAS